MTIADKIKEVTTRLTYVQQHALLNVAESIEKQDTSGDFYADLTPDQRKELDESIAQAERGNIVTLEASKARVQAILHP